MNKTLHIWLAKFKSEKEYFEFFLESYSDDDVEMPINAFAVSQKISFYDHDWLEAYFDKDSLGQTRLIGLHVPGDYVTIVESLAKKHTIIDANAIILFYEVWTGDPKSQVSNPTLWYMGEFNKKTAVGLMPEVEFDLASIPQHWWTDFPRNESELAALEKQSRKRKDNLPSVAKLGVMYMSGHFVGKDKEIAEKYLNRVRPYPEILRECLLANGKAGDGEAWYLLFTMYEEEALQENTSINGEALLDYLNNAAELKCLFAQNTLLGILMYSWEGNKYNQEEDHRRAEKILLNMVDEQGVGEYKLYCLYHMQDGELANPEKAFRWLSIHANKDGGAASLGRMALAYRDEDGVAQNRVQMCKWLFLYKCQRNEEEIEKFKDALDLCDREDIESGRLLARQWIEKFGETLERFEGEKCDPFNQYLQKRI